jgi:hypothetical protein
MTSNAAYDRAREIFYLAVQSLVGHGSLVKRLRNAAIHLKMLQTRELPKDMQDDFKTLVSELTPIVEHKLVPVARITRKHVEKILSMYTELLGGL